MKLAEKPKKKSPPVPDARQRAADERFMALAFAEARAAKGRTLPNPAVGAVVVKNGRMVGRGGTQPAGEAHAEVVALKQAGARARGATVYVTLEPCNHFGRTPPCSLALLDAGVARVVIACPDPSPKAGGGARALRRAGVNVEMAPPGHPWRLEAEDLYTGFFFWLRHGRPRIVVKIAQSVDGRINSRPGVETPLTGPEARRFTHGLRALADAILVGGATIRADDPDLTPRLAPKLPGAKTAPAPAVLVLSRGGRIKTSLQVYAKPRTPQTHVIAPQKPRNLPEWVGFSALPVQATPSPRVLARTLIRIFNDLGYHEILVEGGRSVWTPFLEAGLCDELLVLTAPVLAPAGQAWAKDLSPTWVKPLEFHRFTALGRDSLIEFRRRDSLR
jgi:diaminohydroxyphosphoribosylaminopyrimidine deaminase/5-amino-6-(5-phosphoribosylamino)uracil reductase